MSNKGIIYVMNTVVPGLIKIGKTGTKSFESRMYQLEHNGYCNVTGLKKVFAIEVDDYEDKEKLLHIIFEKSQVRDTELFALDENIAVQLLSSFDGKVFYPKEKKEVIFNQAVENIDKNIPDGRYFFKKKKKSDNRVVLASVEVINGVWILKKGSILGVIEDKGVKENVRNMRKNLLIDKNTGKLTQDSRLGKCSPSCAGSIVMNSPDNGWEDWKTKDGESINKFRK